jgi:hypothetical protein
MVQNCYYGIEVAENAEIDAEHLKMTENIITITST